MSNFTQYRQKYMFSDLEIMIFIGLIFFFIFGAVIFSVSYGFESFIRVAFFAFLFPLVLLYIFDSKSRWINSKRRRIIRKRKHSKVKDSLASVMLFYSGTDDGISSLVKDLSVKTDIQIESKYILDIEYELRQQCIKNNCKAVANISRKNTIYSGFLLESTSSKKQI